MKCKYELLFCRELLVFKVCNLTPFIYNSRKNFGKLTNITRFSILIQCVTNITCAYISSGFGTLSWCFLSIFLSWIFSSTDSEIPCIPWFKYETIMLATSIVNWTGICYKNRVMNILLVLNLPCTLRCRWMCRIFPLFPWN